MSEDGLDLTIMRQRKLLDEARADLQRHMAHVRHYRRTAGHRAPDWLTQLTAKVGGELCRSVGFHEGAIAAFERIQEEWYGR